MNFNLHDAMQLVKEGKAAEAVDMLNKFIEQVQPFSPQSQLIANTLGIDIEFFKIVKYQDFHDEDSEVQALRFKYYAYKVAKWGQQIIAQRKKVKRRHDLVERGTFTIGMMNEIGRTFGVDIDSQEMIESRLSQIHDKQMKRNKIHQKQLIQELEFEKKRSDYKFNYQERDEKLRSQLTKECEKKLSSVKEHLEKVGESQKQFAERKKALVKELVEKRQELMHNDHLLDEKMEGLERMKEEKQQQRRRKQQDRYQRQHSLQMQLQKEQEEYIKQLQIKLAEVRKTEVPIRRTNTAPRQVRDDSEKILIQVIKKYEEMQPSFQKILSNKAEQYQQKKQFEMEKAQKARDNLSHQNTQRTFQSEKINEVRERREQMYRKEIILKKEIRNQRIQNFLQNRQQQDRLKSHQIDRYNDFYSRQTTRLKNMRQSNELVRSSVNLAILQAYKEEEVAASKMSRAVHLISDPDLMVPIKQNENLTINQKVAKKKQNEMQSLLKSFVTNENDFLRFSKAVTEINKNDDININ